MVVPSLSLAPAITGRYDPTLPGTTVEEPTPRTTERSIAVECRTRRPPILISLTCTLRPRRDDQGHLRTEALARADRRGTRTSRSPRIRLKVESGGLEPCRCSRPVPRRRRPTIAPTIFCSDRLAADAGPGLHAHRRPSMCWPWSTSSPERPSMCWSWSTSSPASTNQARCPRCARLRGDRRETGAPGRAERPSKWWGSVLGHLASWHDRGPGGRHDDGARSRWRGLPPPTRPRPDMTVISIPLI